MSDPGHISLQHLKEGVGELVAANKVAQPEIDHISMTWFNQQIIDDALPHHEIVVEDFLDFLLSYPAEKDTGSGRLAQVSDLMKRWMARESAENPMYTRRYLFAMQEVDRLLEGKREVSQRPAAPLSQYSQGGQGGNSSSSSGDISANACSAGQDQGNPPTFGRPAVYAQTTGGRQRSLPLKDPVKEEDTLISLLSDATMSPVPVYRPQSDKWNPHRRPPGNYVCKRCSVPGRAFLSQTRGC
ncbi:hypothetical protein F5Y17DRAFT_35390 [Xylariaceae sp. FL0594]|nr:hypothetical protein F5Y17DRAFT_35390 [Xylariaceae sp. FL0594]